LLLPLPEAQQWPFAFCCFSGQIPCFALYAALPPAKISKNTGGFRFLLPGYFWRVYGAFLKWENRPFYYTAVATWQLA